MNRLVTLCFLFSFFCAALNVAYAEAPELASSCIACHGKEGISSNPNWPNLAGQQRDYLIKEITAFRDKTRVNAAMPSVLLDGVSDQQIEQLADYYSGLAKPPVATAAPHVAGQQVRAHCVSCHGMTGNTVTSLWPNLAGQQAGYIEKQLLDYKAGRREHLIMQVIANELTDQQIKDVAKFYSQHP